MLCPSALMLAKCFPTWLLIGVMVCMIWGQCVAVTKPHVIAFGKWNSTKWPNATGQKLLELKVRPLFVDTRQTE